MKISVAAFNFIVLVSSASAFNVSYLSQLGGPTAPAKAAPPVKELVPSGPASYLDNLNETPALVSAMQSTLAPVAPATLVVAGAALASVDYLSAFVSTNNNPIGLGLTGYLDAIPVSVASPITGASMTTHLDALAGGSAPAAPIVVAPTAPVSSSLATATISAAVSGPGLLTHLDTLHTAAPVSGPGLLTHLDTLHTVPAPVSGPGLLTHLDTLHTDATVCGPGHTGYIDAIQTNSAVSGSTGGSPSVTSFLENVYSQIIALPNDGSKIVSGKSINYSATSGSFAMAFVKK